MTSKILIFLHDEHRASIPMITQMVKKLKYYVNSKNINMHVILLGL